MNGLPHIPLELSQNFLANFSKPLCECVNYIFDKLTNFKGNQNSLDRVAIGTNLGTPNPHVEIHICYISRRISAKFSRRIFVKIFPTNSLAMFYKRSDFH